MKLGNLVLRLRDKATSINLIGGSIDFLLSRKNTLSDEVHTAAFVIPIQEVSDRNAYNEVVQRVTERFSVILAIRMDTNHMDKTGFLAYNELDDLKQELFEAFVGLPIQSIDDNESWVDASVIEFYQGQLIDFHRGYMWYEYTFEYTATIETQAIDLPTDYLDTLRTQLEMAPSDNLPISEDLPVTSFNPDVDETLDLQALRNE